MTTLTLKISDNLVLQKVMTFLSSFKGIEIEEKKEEKNKYNQFEKDLIFALDEIKSHKKGEIKLGNIKDLLKTL